VIVVEKSKNGKVVYLPHEHTPEMQKKIEWGCGVLNDVINEFELKRLETADNKSAAAG
jgi:hypothetical protein